MLKKKTKPEPEGHGSTWTNGRALAGRAVSLVVLAAIAAGPIALVATFARPQEVIAASEERPGMLEPSQQAAGSFALGYVGAWLSATRDDNTELRRYVDVSAIRTLSDVAWEYRDLAVVSIAPAATGDVITVVIAANVKELVNHNDGTSSEEWPRRYFQVVVKTDEVGGLRVVGLPAPIAPPATVERVPALGYSISLPAATPAGDSVLAFLNAYLAGSGDITRYVTPGESITAIDPAPYVSVEAVELRADREPTQSPADGERLRVLAEVSLANVYDQRLTATYALTLTARADRWEITAIDLAP